MNDGIVLFVLKIAGIFAAVIVLAWVIDSVRAGNGPGHPKSIVIRQRNFGKFEETLLIASRSDEISPSTAAWVTRMQDLLVELEG